MVRTTGTSSSLAGWYTSSRCVEAFKRYQKFANEKWRWPITEKIRLYDRALAAFGSHHAPDERRTAFREIYRNLNSYWQVFRGATTRWPADRVFDVLSVQCRNTGIGRLSLNDVARGRGIAEVMDAVAAMKNVKQVKSGRPVTMAISKFLHFFNPTLYPIYDTAIIENKVLSAFKDDWYGFDKRISVPNLHLGLAGYLKYVVWLADLMAKHNDRIMARFRRWLQQNRNDGQGPLSAEAIELAGRSQALVAEIIAIGASQAARRKTR